VGRQGIDDGSVKKQQGTKGGERNGRWKKSISKLVGFGLFCIHKAKGGPIERWMREMVDAQMRGEQ
jgi:hypothetical protein